MNQQTDRPNPSPAELEILRTLWVSPGLTVRDIHKLMPGRGTGYTTVLKTLQIMTEKRLVTREQAGRAHKYYADIAEEKVQRSMVSELVARAFGGAVRKLVLHALSERKPSADELAEIRSLLDRIEEDGRC